MKNYDTILQNQKYKDLVPFLAYSGGSHKDQHGVVTYAKVPEENHKKLFAS